MKKLAVFIIVCVLVCSMGTGVIANGEYEGFFDLYNSWNTEKQVGGQVTREMVYPDGVCGVWSSDGGMENFTVAVTDDERGEKAKADILAAVLNDGAITFTQQKYTYSELKAVHNAVDEYVRGYTGEELGVAGWGIYEMQNRVHVDIIVSKPGAEDFMRWGYENFGDMIMFESVDGYAVPTAEELLGESGGSYGGLIVAVLAVAAIVCAVLAARKRLFAGGKGEGAK